MCSKPVQLMAFDTQAYQTSVPNLACEILLSFRSVIYISSKRRSNQSLILRLSMMLRKVLVSTTAWELIEPNKKLGNKSNSHHQDEIHVPLHLKELTQTTASFQNVQYPRLSCPS